jgi:hypothetical protein
MDDMIRDSVQAELARRHWTIYRLIQELGEPRLSGTIYGWLNNGRQVRAGTANKVLQFLGLKIS